MQQLMDDENQGLSNLREEFSIPDIRSGSPSGAFRKGSFQSSIDSDDGSPVRSDGKTRNGSPYPETHSDRVPSEESTAISSERGDIFLDDTVAARASSSPSRTRALEVSPNKQSSMTSPRRIRGLMRKGLSERILGSGNVGADKHYGEITVNFPKPVDKKSSIGSEVIENHKQTRHEAKDRARRRFLSGSVTKKVRPKTSDDISSSPRADGMESRVHKVAGCEMQKSLLQFKVGEMLPVIQSPGTSLDYVDEFVEMTSSEGEASFESSSESSSDVESKTDSDNEYEFRHIAEAERYQKMKQLVTGNSDENKLEHDLVTDSYREGQTVTKGDTQFSSTFSEASSMEQNYQARRAFAASAAGDALSERPVSTKPYLDEIRNGQRFSGPSLNSIAHGTKCNDADASTRLEIDAFPSAKSVSDDEPRRNENFTLNFCPDIAEDNRYHDGIDNNLVLDGDDNEKRKDNKQRKAQVPAKNRYKSEKQQHRKKSDFPTIPKISDRNSELATDDCVKMQYPPLDEGEGLDQNIVRVSSQSAAVEIDGQVIASEDHDLYYPPFVKAVSEAFPPSSRRTQNFAKPTRRRRNSIGNSDEAPPPSPRHQKKSSKSPRPSICKGESPPHAVPDPPASKQNTKSEKRAKAKYEVNVTPTHWVRQRGSKKTQDVHARPTSPRQYSDSSDKDKLRILLEGPEHLMKGINLDFREVPFNSVAHEVVAGMNSRDNDTFNQGQEGYQGLSIPDISEHGLQEAYEMVIKEAYKRAISELNLSRIRILDAAREVDRLERDVESLRQSLNDTILP